MESLARQFPQNVVASFGIHPQNPDVRLFPVLEKLAEQRRLVAVGEAGFDFFTPELAANWHQQREVWQLQLEQAQKHQLPLVIHCRKAMDKIFLYCKDLKKLPAVVFHAFPGSCQEAENLLKRGIEGYFSLARSCFGAEGTVFAVYRSFLWIDFWQKRTLPTKLCGIKRLRHLKTFGWCIRNLLCFVVFTKMK